MGSIITVANSKGGGGKTGLVTCLAVDLVKLGYRVAVVDSDKSQIFAKWHARAYEGPPLTCTSEITHSRIVDHAQAQAASHDVVIIDTAGFENLTASYSIATADYVLIPCTPDAGCAMQTLETAQQVDNMAKAARRPIPVSVVRTRWNSKGLSEGATLADLSSLDILDTMIPKLVAFEQMTYTGQVPLQGKLGLLVDALVTELVGKGAIPALSATSDAPKVDDRASMKDSRGTKAIPDRKAARKVMA